ncbi:hypothetical protein ACOMHN_041442 [Nucella lapillus]
MLTSSVWTESAGRWSPVVYKTLTPCLVRNVKVAKSFRKPRTVLSRVTAEDGTTAVSKPDIENCLTQPPSYVLVATNGFHTVYKNRHCLQCDVGQTQPVSCHPVHEEEINAASPYFYSGEMLWNDINRT